MQNIQTRYDYLSTEVMDWLLENVGPVRPRKNIRWDSTCWSYCTSVRMINRVRVSGCEIRFRYPNDAMLFKLTWMGL